MLNNCNVLNIIFKTDKVLMKFTTEYLDALHNVPFKFPILLLSNLNLCFLRNALMLPQKYR